DLELAGQVVEGVVAAQLAGDLEGEWRGVDQLVVGDAGQRASGDVADDIAAGANVGQARGVQGFHDVRQGLDGEPVVLDVLADGDVGEVIRVAAGNVAEDADLVSAEDA